MIPETLTPVATTFPGTASPAPKPIALWAAIATVILAAFAAYHNTFALPFVFDDQIVVIDNTTLRDLRDWRAVLGAPHDGSGAAGRPLLNLSLALNYAAGGLDVRGYHFVNLLLHTSSALLLFSLVRRTLSLPLLRGKFGPDAIPLSLAIAVLWAVHPLNTESVACISQRTELLVAFFYLLTPLAIVRSTEAAGWNRWHGLAVVSCLLGMASKEVMATMPLIALLYDRTFIAGSFREAWRQRRGMYVGLMSTWLVLGMILFRMGGSRGVAAGFGLGVTPWSYALKQCEAILHYLRLVVWPSPLILDYGTDVIHTAREVLPQGLVLLALLGLTVFALIRRPMLGFFGAWFFIILGPSSSFVPLVAQTEAEHRMYLPVLGIIAPVVIGAHLLFGRWSSRAWIVVAAVLGIATVKRNEVYQTEVGLWRDTARHRPTNPRAHLCLGMAYMKNGDSDEAVASFLEVLLLDPTHSTANNSLGQIFAARGWTEDALEHYEIALEGRDNHAAIHSNMCDALRTLGRFDEALRHGEEAVRLDPKLAAAQGNLGLVLANAGREAEAIPHYEAALRLDPDFATAHNNLGVALMNLGRVAEAREHLARAVRLAPDMAAARNSLGAALDHLGEKDAAAKEFEAALRIQPDFEGARRNLDAVRNAKR